MTLDDFATWFFVAIVRAQTDLTRQCVFGCRIFCILVSPAEGSLPDLDFEIPFLEDYQVAKDVWFWFAAQQSGVGDGETPTPSDATKTELSQTALPPVSESSMTSNGARTGSKNGSEGESTGESNISLPESGKTATLNGDGDSAADIAAAQMLSKALDNSPWVLKFLLIFHSCANKTKNSGDEPLEAEPYWARLLGALDIDPKLRSLVRQDVAIAHKLLRSAASLEVEVYYEDFKLFALDDMLEQLLNLDSGVSTPTTESWLTVAENVDGERLCIASRPAGSGQEPQRKTPDPSVQIETAAESVHSGGGGGSGGDGSAGKLKSEGAASKFVLFSRDSTEDDPEGEPRTEEKVNPAMMMGTVKEEFVKYRDGLYSGKYEFIEGMGTIECAS